MNKLKQLAKLKDELNEKAGSSVLKFGSETTDFEFLDTPFVTVNELTGGIPRGRFTTLAGPQHTGKGVFALQLIAHHMQKDPEFIAMWMDAENAFDPVWAEKLGVDLDRLLIHKYSRERDTMEKMMDDALSIVKKVNIDIWVIDSIGALLPQADVYDSKDKGKSLEGTKMLNLQVKLGEFYRKANVLIAPDEQKDYKGCAVILLGQIYAVPTANATLEEVRGGNAVKHWAHLRLLTRRSGKAEWPEPIDVVGLDGKKRKIYPGWAGRIKLDKDRKTGNEGQEVLLTFKKGMGFDSRESVLSAAFGREIITRAGAFYSCADLGLEKIRGKDNIVKMLEEDEDLFQKLSDLVAGVAIQDHIKQRTETNLEEETND